VVQLYETIHLQTSFQRSEGFLMEALVSSIRGICDFAKLPAFARKAATAR